MKDRLKDHLEGWQFCENCGINVVLDDRDAVLFRISRAFPNLAFNGFFTLVIR